MATVTRDRELLRELVALVRGEADNLARYTRRAINAQMRRLAREGEGGTR